MNSNYCLFSYQSEALQWDFADINWTTLGNVYKFGLQNCHGTHNMYPPEKIQKST